MGDAVLYDQLSPKAALDQLQQFAEIEETDAEVHRTTEESERYRYDSSSFYIFFLNEKEDNKEFMEDIR